MKGGEIIDNVNMDMDGLAKDIVSAAISQLAVGDYKQVLEYLAETYSEEYAAYFTDVYVTVINTTAEEILLHADTIAKACMLYVPHLYCTNCNQIMGPGPDCQHCDNDEFYTG